ncbi:hypothetical protein HY971_05100 [Candidatus Kaiserbacteria bacterium]|nr:hypothetical protein [Candidatus Kaiserbacteria bacterium]
MYRITTAVVVVIILALGLFFFYRSAGEDGSKIASSTPQASTTTLNGVTGTGNFTVSSVPTLTVPDFRAPIKFGADVPADVRAALQKSADIIIAKLTKDSLDLRAWIELGGVHKMGGDYKGAESAWLFVTQASPKNAIAYGNLADLYMNFLKDYSKAEAQYLKVISLEPSNIDPYRSLALLYTNFYKKGTSAAEDILKKGIRAIPDSTELKVLLERLLENK